MLAGEANENENENVPERDDGYVSAGVSLPQYPEVRQERPQKATANDMQMMQ